MSRVLISGLKWALSALLAVLLLFAAAAGALAWWLSGEGPRQRVQALASERLDVPVTLGRLSLTAWPWPVVVVQDVKIATQAPLSAQRIELRPVWRKLIGLGSQARVLEVESLSLLHLSLPQRGLDEVLQTLSKKEQTSDKNSRPAVKNAPSLAQNASAAAVGEPAPWWGTLTWPQRTRLEAVVWQSTAGEQLAFSGDLIMNAPRDQLDVHLRLAGGSLRGQMRLLSERAQPGWRLHGRWETADVDLALLPGVRQRIAGRLFGTTDMDAFAPQWAKLVSALQTSSTFRVSAAVIKGLDLARAVSTLGLSRGGETALQHLSGTLSTRGTGTAMRLTLSDLHAQSRILQARGAVSVGAASSPGAARALNGKIHVDLTAGSSKLGQAVDQSVGQLLGIPLEISGTTAAPQVQPTRGAMIGGAMGSVIAPVIGTGAGAKLGDQAANKLTALKQKLFGN
jgi:hypothetical protein